MKEFIEWRDEFMEENPLYDMIPFELLQELYVQYLKGYGDGTKDSTERFRKLL